MNRSMIVFGVMAAALTLGGCSSADNATTPHATTTTPAATTSGSSASVSPSAAASSSPNMPSSTASALALAESCRVAVKHQRGALTQLQTYVKNPLKGGVSAKDLKQTRQQLQDDAEKAPAPLANELRSQVGVFDAAVRGISTKNIKNIDLATLQAAQARVAAICKTPAN